MKKMIMMREAFMRFVRDERGLAAVEYAIIAGLIAVGLAAIFGGIGDSITGIMETLSAELSGAGAGGGGGGGGGEGGGGEGAL